MNDATEQIKDIQGLKTEVRGLEKRVTTVDGANGWVNENTIYALLTAEGYADVIVSE